MVYERSDERQAETKEDFMVITKMTVESHAILHILLFFVGNGVCTSCKRKRNGTKRARKLTNSFFQTLFILVSVCPHHRPPLLLRLRGQSQQIPLVKMPLPNLPYVWKKHRVYKRVRQ